MSAKYINFEANVKMRFCGCDPSYENEEAK